MRASSTSARTRGGRLLARTLIAGTGATAAAFVLMPGIASAQDAKPIPVTGQEVNLLWVVIGAVLVIFMQAGFALVETGFCRAKHAAHVVSSNFAIFGLGFIAYYLLGYGFMFGGFTLPAIGMDHAAGGPLIGHGSWVFLWKGGFALTDMRGAGGAAALGFFLYMVAFMDTTATIPTGAMAERWKWSAFVGWGLFCGAIYYPLFGAWTWGGGWLAQLGNSMNLGLGYVDFAGSGVVHAMGGAAGLAGALVLGPRIGKYKRDGTPNKMPGHHIPMAMLGTFILLFGWFGFNAASTFAATDVQFATVAANTAIAAAFGAIIAMSYVMLTGEKKPDPGMMANGMLAGLVAITAPCAFVDPWAAALIGSVAGVLVVVSVNFIEKRGLDDPVGAVSVHGVCGIWGVLSIGLFAERHLRRRLERHDQGRCRGLGQGCRRHLRWRLQPRPAPVGCPGHGSPGHLHGDVRPRLRVLQDPERGDEGWHPAAGRCRDGRVSTSPRWVRWRTRSSSRSRSRPTSSRRSRS